LVGVKIPRTTVSQQARNSQILKVGLNHIYPCRASLTLRQAHAKELVLLGFLFHPNVLPLEGIFLSSGDIQRICMVSPWMENNDLVTFLRRFPTTLRLPLVSITHVLCLSLAKAEFNP
jgi:hypothetical protein